METKNQNLTRTQDALAGLSEALLKLNAAADAKKELLKKQNKQTAETIEDREKRLEILKASSEKISAQIDHIIENLDKVLENDGTGNNNN